MKGFDVIVEVKEFALAEEVYDCIEGDEFFFSFYRLKDVSQHLLLIIFEVIDFVFGLKDYLAFFVEFLVVLV